MGGWVRPNAYVCLQGGWVGVAKSLRNLITRISKKEIWEHSYMTSDFWVGRYVKLHLMISDVGRWVGQRGSDVRSAIFEFLLFSVYF